MSENCVAGTAIRYGLDDEGIESRCCQDFLFPSTRALGPIHPPLEWVLDPFHEDKSAGLWCYNPAPSTTEVKEKVALYIYSPFGLSMRGLS